MRKTLFITMLAAALMGSAYANTDYTATPEALQTSAPDYIYSVYADSGNASGGYVEVFEVETGGYESLFQVYGGYTGGDGAAFGNTVTMSGGYVVANVYGGGVSYSGDATDNTVTMTGGYVGGDVSGGCVYDSGDATGNTVTITGGEVRFAVSGGCVYDSGDATGNTVTMTGGYVGGDVSGGYVYDSGDATGNTVTMSGGEVVSSVYGGGVYNSGDATGNMVIMNNGFVYSAVCAGMTLDGEASGNIVIMSGGSVSSGVYGGASYGGNATDNTVIMTGGFANRVYGGYTDGNATTGNTVHLVGEGASYTAGDTTYQGSQIKIQGSVYAGYVDHVKNAGGSSTNNSVNVYGTGINIGGTIGYSQQLTFHLVQGQAGAPGTPMVTLGGSLNLEGVEIGFYGDAVTDWAAFNGKSITLVNMTNETITGMVQPTDSVDITDEAGKTVATATLTLSEDLQTLFLTDIQGVDPVPAAEADALDVTLVNSLWASSAYVREFVRLSGAQGYALKNGDTAVWGGGFGTFMHATGDKGFKSNGGGYGIGVNHAFSANTQAGISFGQGFGTYHNSGADGATVHQRAILAAATVSTRVGKDFSLGGHLAYGSVRNRADCRLDGATERARWNDNVFNLGVQAAYDFHVTDATAITPFLGLDWAYGAQESFNGAYGRHYTHGRLNELRMPVGVTVSTSTEAGTTKLLPQLSVAYVPSLAQQNPHAGVTRADGNYRVKGYAPGRNAFMLNAGVNAVFSDSWSAGAFYTLETRRHSVDQSVNASVRYTF